MTTFIVAQLIPFFSVTFLATIAIAAYFASPILQICFRNGKDFQAPPGCDTTLKILVEGSTAEVRKLIAERRISSSLAQLQKLDLPRERRRRINRKIVVSLAAGQAKAFAKLKRLARKETAQAMIDDFTHSPDSCIGLVKDTIEDLKDSMKEKYDAMSCSCSCSGNGCSTGNGCCGRCRYQVQCC